MKTTLVSSTKLHIKLGLRLAKDIAGGTWFTHADKVPHALPFPFSVWITQMIRPSTHVENKIHNLRIGIQKIEAYVIRPGQTFSFWRAVGKPDAQNGYKLGRNIISGELREDYGGGLCQLSGIMYHTALLAGLHITERYNHSVDIYRDEDRFTPLGADATVVYGHKDLRFKNNFPFALRFQFVLKEHEIECRLLSPEKIEPQELVFERTDNENHKTVLTKSLTDGGGVVATSVYRK